MLPVVRFGKNPLQSHAKVGLGRKKEPLIHVSYNASHPLATPYQVIVEKYLGVLCAGTKNAITVPAKSRRSFYTQKILWLN